MESLKPYKNILIGGGILLLVFGGYMFWRSRNAADESGSALVASDAFSGSGTVVSPEAAAAGQQIISILNELRQLKIEKGIFDDAVFDSLVDYTIATTSEEKGRPDPFAPLPFEFETESEKK